MSSKVLESCKLQVIACSTSCGPGVESRDVICMRNLGRAFTVVGKENCLDDDKPASTQPCQRPACLSSWFMTQWSECSHSCDTGSQTREIKCLTAEEEISSECELASKPVVRQACNTQPCTRSADVSPTQSSGNTCVDQLDASRCRLVVQGRMCRYDYYRNQCCHSCAEYDRLHPQQS